MQLGDSSLRTNYNTLSAKPSTADPPQDLPVPKRIGSYEILRELGRGGMGVVYEAKDIRLKRTVALKMILAGAFADPDQVGRFRAEAEAIARLHHSHIVQIYEIGDYEGYPFFALEYLEGGSLRYFCDGKPQPPAWAAWIVQKLAQAMAYAHQQGIIHRDLKPANILLTQDDGLRLAEEKIRSSLRRELSTKMELQPALSPKITDFGLAKLDPSRSGEGTGTAASHTRTGDIIGTPNYMAPEQAQGRGGPVDPTVDIYALGAILYELLTGRPPFDGPTPMDTLLRVLSEEVLPPHRLQPKIPRDLETICLKCLQKEPYRRYLSAGELAQDLERFLTGEPIKARPAGKIERTIKWVRRRPLVAGLLTIVCLMTALALVSLSWAVMEMRSSAETERQGRLHALAARTKESQLREKAQDAEQTALYALSAAQRNLYYSRISQAQLLWEKSDIAKVRKLLQDCVPSPGQADPRAWEWRYLQGLCDTDLRTMQVDNWIHCLAHCPQTHLLAVGHANPYGNTALRPGFVELLDTRTGTRLQRYDKGDLKTPLWLGFNREGTKLLCHALDGKLHVWTTADFTHHSLPLPQIPREAMGTTLALAGTLYIQAQPGSPVKLWNWQTGKEAPWPRGQAPTAAVACLNREGTVALTLSDAGEGRLWNLTTGQETGRLTDGLPAPQHVQFSPAGRYVAALFKSGQCRVWEVATHKVVGTYHTAAPSGIFFSPDETHLISHNQGQPIAWNLRTGEKPRLQPSGHHIANDLTCSPDGLFAATVGVDNTVRLYQLATGNELRIYRGHETGVTSVRFEAEGRTLVSGDQRGNLKVWDITRDQAYAATNSTLGERFAALGFSADSKQVHAAIAVPEGNLISYSSQSGTPQSMYSLPLTDATAFPRHDMMFSGDGRWLCGVCRGGKEVGVWDVATGQERLRLKGFPTPVFAVAINRDGSVFATAHQHQVDATQHHPRLTIWNGHTGQKLHQENWMTGLHGVALSADGTRLVIGAPRTFRVQGRPNEVYGPAALWEPLQKKTLASPGPNVPLDAMGLAISPKGDKVAVASFSRTPNNILIYEMNPWRLVKTFHGPSNLTGIAFSPDGQRLATTGYNSTVTLWDVESGVDVLTLRLPDTRLRDMGYTGAVAFSPDGRKLAASNFVGRTALYDAPPLHLTAELQKPQRRLAAAEAAATWHLRMVEENFDHPWGWQFHLTELKKMTLPAFQHARRAHVQAQLGQWREALADYALLFKDEELRNANECVIYALLLHLTGNTSGLQQFQERVRQTTFAKRSSTGLENQLWSLAVGTAPLTTPEKEYLERLLHSVAAMPDKLQEVFYVLARAELRRNQPEAALRYIAQARRMDPTWRQVFLYPLVEAQAALQLGRREEAQRHFAAATAWRQERSQGLADAKRCPPHVFLNEWLDFLSLYEAVQQRLQEAKP
jgi:serine/threonine protein kinase/WD40 repeat protein